jgi:hypothetical protein
MREENVDTGRLRQARMRRELLAVIQRQRVPSLRLYPMESADSRLVQGDSRPVRHDFRQKKPCFPVHKHGYIGVFAGAFNSVGLPVPDPWGFSPRTTLCNS